MNYQGKTETVTYRFICTVYTDNGLIFTDGCLATFSKPAGTNWSTHNVESSSATLYLVG